MRQKSEISSVRSAYANLPPFVIVEEENRGGKPKLGGFMPDILEVLSKWMNLSVTFIREPEDQYGTFENGTWTGMCGMIYKNKTDLALNPLLSRSDFLNFGFYTNPVTIEAFTMLSGKAIEEPGLFLYFNVLLPSVWGGVFISLLAVALVSTFVYKKISDVPGVTYIRSWGEYIWLYFAYMMHQGPSGRLLCRGSRSRLSALLSLLVMIWWIGVAFLIMNVFQSRLVSKLTIVKSKPLVDSMEDFVNKTKIEATSAEEIAIQVVLNDPSLPLYEATWKRIEHNLIPMSEMFSSHTLDRVEKGEVTMIHGHLILESILQARFKERGTCNFHIMKDYFFPFPLTMGIHKRLPRRFLRKFNYGLTRLIDADISGKWLKPNFEGYELCENYQDKTLQPLKFDNILGVLLLWGAGMTLSAVTLGLEILQNKWMYPCKGSSDEDRKTNRRESPFRR